MITFCSIVASSNRAAARVLAEELREHHPSDRVWMLEDNGERAAVPRVLQDALAQGADVAVYIDPEARVYGPLEAIRQLAREHSVVVARRVTTIPDDGMRPDRRDLLRAGQFSDGLVAVAPSQEGQDFLEWWMRRLELGQGDHEPWLDQVPDLFPGAGVLEDSGYGVSFWNLHERRLERRGDELYAAKRPLRLIQFTGFRPDRPYWLNDKATRVRVVDSAVLSELCGQYAERLRASGWIAPAPEPERLPVKSSEAVADAALGVNVIGYLADTLGLAEAARLYVVGLSAAGIPVTTTAIAPDLPVDSNARPPSRAGHHSYPESREAVAPSFNLACLNGDQLEAFVRLDGKRVLGSRPTIGQWAWETDVLPPSWLDGFRHVDEIWVNSTFVAANLGRLSPVPVVVVPQPIVVPDAEGVELDVMRDERFTFVFMLDFFSTLRRKNALGLVEAFGRAFTPGEGPRLLLKTINAQFRPKAAAELGHKIGRRQDIELIDDYFDPLQKTALLAQADCYVSLHRSEGFGLTLAESMALGTPVVATGYSGNIDFMTGENSYLVDWSPTHVGPDSEIYPSDGIWAEPDLDHAAQLMRRVWEHPAEARAKAQRALEDIARQYSPETVGSIARKRLERLSARRLPVRLAAPSAAPESFHALRAALAVDVRRGAPPVPQGPAGLLRRLMLRLMSPFTYHERKIDRALFDAIVDLRADLERAQHDRAALLQIIDEELGRRERER